MYSHVGKTCPIPEFGMCVLQVIRALYKGGFQSSMTPSEAALILGIRSLDARCTRIFGAILIYHACMQAVSLNEKIKGCAPQVDDPQPPRSRRLGLHGNEDQ